MVHEGGLFTVEEDFFFVTLPPAYDEVFFEQEQEVDVDFDDEG